MAHVRRVLEASPFHGEGYRKVWAKLRVEGRRTSKERVRRLMREHDLQAPQRAGHAHGPKAHDGTITTEAPDVMWGTDMTVPTENLIRTVRVTDRADVGPANDGNVSIAAVHSVNVDEWLASFGRSSGRRARRARSSGGDRPWRSSGRVTMVAVVQAAHVRHRHDLARCSRLDASAHGRILAQREMRAPVLVVVDVRSQYSVE